MAALNTEWRGGEQGQAIVELALTLPLLMLVVLGVFDFGLMFQRYEVITNAAREGARLAVLPGYEVEQAEALVGEYLSRGGVPGIPVRTCGGDLTPGKLCVLIVPSTVDVAAAPPAKLVNVMVARVEYDHPYAFVGPIMSLFSGNLGTTRLSAISTMRREGT